MELDLSIAELCGQLLVVGFEGHALSASLVRALGAGERAGVILFKRNLGAIDEVAALCRSVLAAAPDASPPFVSIDQEGGRVARLGAPLLELPPMRALGHAGDLALTRRVAEVLGRQLAALGVNLDFAPVMDVDSNPDNPVIGDRAFGSDPRTVMRHGVAFLQGLQAARVLACAKHFPGHGDTARDSHVELPYVDHPRERLMRVEVPPFRAASGAGVAAMMSAHVVYRSLDADVPATFSRAICASLLRREMGFEGALFSDDLEMGAIAGRWPIEEAACEAIWAGCDLLLVCKSEELAGRAHAALVKRAEGDGRFRERCREAAARSLKLRRLCPPRPEPVDVGRTIDSAEARLCARALAEALARPAPSEGEA